MTVQCHWKSHSELELVVTEAASLILTMPALAGQTMSTSPLFSEDGTWELTLWPALAKNQE